MTHPSVPREARRLVGDVVSWLSLNVAPAIATAGVLEKPAAAGHLSEQRLDFTPQRLIARAGLAHECRRSLSSRVSAA